MLVILPTHPGDRQLAVNLCEHIAFLGGVKNHECLIVTPAGTNLEGIANVLQGAFGTVFLHQYHPTMQGWPFGPNEIASEAMLHAWVNPALRYHYLMLEPDCVPVNKYWLDMLDVEYRRSNMPVLGVKIDTVAIGTNRVVGRHVVGVAVYPKNFPQLCPLVRGIKEANLGYYAQKAIAPPWDAYFGAYTVKLTAETELIQHLSRKRNQGPAGITWDCPTLENALSQVRPEAILVHGSKHPEFLYRLTERTPHASARKIESQNHAEKRETQRETESLRSEASPALQNAGDHPGDQGGQESSAGAGEGDAGNVNQSPVKLTGKEKIRLRQTAAAEEVRQKVGIAAALGTPEFDRAKFFHFLMPWGKLRKYATKMGVATFGKQKADIVNELVLIERRQGKEKWTKGLPKLNGEMVIAESASRAPIPVEEAPLVGPFNLSSSAGTGGGMQTMVLPHGGVIGTIIPEDGGNPAIAAATSHQLDDDRARRMKELLRARGLPGGM